MKTDLTSGEALRITEPSTDGCSSECVDSCCPTSSHLKTCDRPHSIDLHPSPKISWDFRWPYNAFAIAVVTYFVKARPLQADLQFETWLFYDLAPCSKLSHLKGWLARRLLSSYLLLSQPLARFYCCYLLVLTFLIWLQFFIASSSQLSTMFNSVKLI